MLTVAGVPIYLVETYLRGNARGRATHERQARSAAEQLTRDGTRVHFQGAIHIPEDEICFFTFDATSARVAAAAARLAGLEPLRIVEADLDSLDLSIPPTRHQEHP